MSVDLPAPFWPISVWISPGNNRKSTFCNALTPGNDFDRPMVSSMGEAIMEPRRSVFTLRQDLRRDAHREHGFVGDDALGQLLACHHIFHRGHELRPEQRTAFDVHVD